MIRFLSTGKKGSAVGLDPEAIITFLAVTVSVLPSGLVSFIVFFSTN